MKNMNATLSETRFGHLGKTFFKALLSFSIFLFFMSMPASVFSEEPSEKIEQEAGFYYTIKKGDTLWDLSQRFSDTPWVWPNLWEENKQIPNPHWIYPGNRIRLYHKGWVKELEKPVQTVVEEETVYFFYQNIDMVGFIRKEAVPPSASIFKSKNDRMMISKGDLVYLRKENKNDFIPGSRYTVYDTLKEIKDAETGAYIGIQHYLKGIIEIIQNEEKLAVGKVIFSFRPIEIEDKLMPYQQRAVEIPITQSTQGVSGKVIVAEEHQKIFGDYTLAFFDKGKKDGIKIGQIYGLFEQEEATLSPKSKEKVLLPPQNLGQILVLHTEETTSTVIITKSYDPINAGTKVMASRN